MFPFVDSPILVGFIAGRSARAIEGYSNRVIIKQAVNILQSMFGHKVRPPTGAVVTRWYSDPFAGGSYSFIPFGASGADYDAIAEPVGERLFFAGEASNRRYCATVHGAFLSGIREAERISHLTD
jgi:monoamine oxidase